MMEYVSVHEAAAANGLRMILTGGAPAVWSEAAKGVLRVRSVEYVPVFQVSGAPNEDIVAWSGHRNAPTAMYNDEPARVTAPEIIALAERLGTGPSLIPENAEDRVRMFGLLNELAGENGFGWNVRTLMIAGMVARIGEAEAAGNHMLQEYHFSPHDVPTALSKVSTTVQLLTHQCEQNTSNDRHYFFGNSVSALDVYWACFSQMLAPLPHDYCPMPDVLRSAFSGVSQAFKSAGYELHPVLIKHRDYVFQNYLQWPMEF